jgi:hypothetical protein
VVLDQNIKSLIIPIFADKIARTFGQEATTVSECYAGCEERKKYSQYEYYLQQGWEALKERGNSPSPVPTHLSGS